MELSLLRRKLTDSERSQNTEKLTRVRNPSAFESIKTNTSLTFLRAIPQNALRKLNNVLVLIDRNADGFGNGAKLTLDRLDQLRLRSESVCISIY